MRKLLLIVLSMPILANSQIAGYGSAGVSMFSCEKFETSVGGNFGIGIRTGAFTTGLSFDVFTFGEHKTKYSIVSADFRTFLEGLDDNISPFIAAQPGFVLFNNKVNGINTKGSVSFAILAGMNVRLRNKFPGLLIGMGYQNISFQTTGKIERYDGVKLNVSLTI